MTDGVAHQLLDHEVRVGHVRAWLRVTLEVRPDLVAQRPRRSSVSGVQVPVHQEMIPDTADMCEIFEAPGRGCGATERRLYRAVKGSGVRTGWSRGPRHGTLVRPDRLSPGRGSRFETLR